MKRRISLVQNRGWTLSIKLLVQKWPIITLNLLLLLYINNKCFFIWFSELTAQRLLHVTSEKYIPYLLRVFSYVWLAIEIVLRQESFYFIQLFVKITLFREQMNLKHYFVCVESYSFLGVLKLVQYLLYGRIAQK